MENIEPNKEEVKNLLDRAREDAQERYELEPGRRKEVDSGEITMEELAIHCYIYLVA
ncbi:hypothetical protein KKA15_04350 [Patescibacteria group bacterium]|nr:hypothetical protein [Patescibacteria group bacterium]